MKVIKKRLRRVNNTKGYNLKKGELHELTMTFHTGWKTRYIGKTKKSCMEQFKDKYGSTKGCITQEWNIYKE